MTTIFPATDKQDLAVKVAERFIALVRDIQDSEGGAHDDGIARVVLTGGSSGLAVLEALAQTAHSHELDWSRIEFFFGDERNVPVDDSESNEGQARRVLLDQLEIPAHRVQKSKNSHRQASISTCSGLATMATSILCSQTMRGLTTTPPSSP